MAFNKVAQASRLLNVSGPKCELVCGMTTLSGGAGTGVAVQLKSVHGVVALAQSANAVTCTATSGNQFTLAGTSSDVIMWLAWGTPRL